MRAAARRRIANSLRVLGYALASAALFVVALVLLAFAVLVGCGYSEPEMQVQRDRVELLQTLLDKCEGAARSSAAQARACRRSSEPQP